METVHRLQREEELHFSLQEAKKKAWYQMRADEENENWREYNFVKDPTLFEGIGSLLVQLKLLT